MLSKNDLSHSILRAQKTHVLSKIASSLTLDSARTENVHVKYDCLKTYNLFSTYYTFCPYTTVRYQHLPLADWLNLNDSSCDLSI